MVGAGFLGDALMKEFTGNRNFLGMLTSGGVERSVNAEFLN